ncbi:MAG: hypothetical protein EXR71_18375 [Myxococcales bacterium]|nr:hypothetical protein [Myxococcales bacterium]
MLALLLACADPPICGDGTVERDGACVAEAAGDTDSGEALPPLDVYILAGQSNMDGYAYLSGLPPSWRTADPRVPMYWSGWGEFRDLQPTSYGGAYLSGPEVSFGRTLADAGHRLAIVKHAVSGTDLANFWYPGATPGDASAGEGFAVLVDSLDAAKAELDRGEPWRWAGFVWMQGESDALDLDMAHAYEDNLRGLVDAMRELTAEPELPVVIGLISREAYWTFADLVRGAEMSVAESEDAIVMVETDDLPRNPLDLAHYDGPSNRTLGERFAAAVTTLTDFPASTDAPTPLLTLTDWRLDYDFTGTCGYEFTLDRSLELVDVGTFGAGNYVYTSADVGLWDADGNLLLRQTVPGWVDAPTTPRDNFSYTAIEPLILEAGTYRLGVVSWPGDNDRYTNNASGRWADGVSFDAAVYAEGYWLLYPQHEATGAGISFAGPNLLWRETE